VNECAVPESGPMDGSQREAHRLQVEQSKRDDSPERALILGRCGETGDIGYVVPVKAVVRTWASICSVQ